MLHILVFLVLFPTGAFVVEPRVSERVESLALTNLREWLRPDRLDPASVPVAVCDVSSLYDLEGNQIVRPIGSERWERFFAELRALDPPPLAIGFDIDVSPGTDGIMRSEHEALIAQMKHYTADTGVPTYVGVGRGLLVGPEHWLPKDARHLAAAIFLPTDLTAQPLFYEDTRTGDRLPAMGAVLGRAKIRPEAFGQRDVFQPRHWIESDPRFPPELRAPRFLVDYSLLKHAEEITAFTGPPEGGALLDSLSRSMLEGKIVLVGKADPLRDQDYFAYDEHRQPAGGDIMRGIYAHACAAYTMAQAPIQQLHHAESIALDAFIGLLGLALALFWPWQTHLDLRRPKTLAWHYGGVLVRLAVALVPLGLAYLLAHQMRVLWLDFLGAWVYLLFEPLLAPFIEGWSRTEAH